jgi:hypothetical protein
MVTSIRFRVHVPDKICGLVTPLPSGSNRPCYLSQHRVPMEVLSMGTRVALSGRKSSLPLWGELEVARSHRPHERPGDAVTMLWARAITEARRIFGDLENPDHQTA